MARSDLQVRWMGYAVMRAARRGFPQAAVEQILLHSTERYAEPATGRRVAIGRIARALVLVVYETDGPDTLVPVTMHTTTRRQIASRVQRGDLSYG